MIVCHGRRSSSAARAEIVAQVEATELHQLLARTGFHLLPFRLPRGLDRGNLRLRLVWKKAAGAETQIVRLTHEVVAPDRV